MPDIPIDNMLADFGLAASEYRKARAALFEWEIIQKSPHRKNIAAHKADFAREVLEDAFLWHCNNGECRQAAARDEAAASNAAAGNTAARPLLLVAQSVCRICGGDPSASVLAQAGQALAAAGVRRILIVGGTERKERELRQKSPPDLDWRFIDGKRVQDDRYYQPHRDWAQVIIIWQSTPLDHKVSEHFDGKGDPRVITVRRRGVIAVAQELISHVSRP